MNELRRVKAIVRIFCFILVFLMLLQRGSNLLRLKNGGSTDRIHSFYDIPEGTLDVLVLGSSHAYYGFQPGVLWNEYGISSHVMGSNKQSVATSCFLLKEALKYQRPKVVLFETYLMGIDDLYVDEGCLRQAVDSMRLGSVKHELIQEFLPEASWKDKLSYYVPFLKYHSRWSELTSDDFEKDYFFHGGNLDFGLKEGENPGLDFPPGELPERNLIYLNEMIDICRENNILFAAFATPYMTLGAGYEFRQSMNLALEPWFADRDIPFFFFQKEPEGYIDYKSDFRDETHVNYYGQEKITAEIGAYLKENLDLPNHRGDDSYQSWEKDLTLYLAEKQKRLG